MKKYELWFTPSNDKDLKILTFEINDMRFKEYILDTIMNDLEDDFKDLEFELDLEDGSLDNWVIIEKKENE
jgi:hypothetical protein